MYFVGLCFKINFLAKALLGFSNFLYTMDTRDILVHGFGLILDPSTMTMPIDEFLGKYGGYIDTLAIIAKSPEGVAYYPSNSAPRHSSFEGFFPVVSSIANDIGIKVYGVIYSNVDQFLGKDPNFRIVKSGGVPVEGYVCPGQETYWHYLASVAQEVASYDIEGIILKDIAYPHEEYCFCDTCRHNFAMQTNITDRDFGLDYIKRSKILYERWLEMRVSNIEQLVRTVVQTVKSQKNVKILPEIIVEKEIGYFDGAYVQYGEDYTRLIETSNHVMLSLNPWSQKIPPRDSEEYNELVNLLTPFRELSSRGLKTTLFMVSPDEEMLESIDAVKSYLGSENIFVQEHLPKNYLELRSRFLGLGV